MVLLFRVMRGGTLAVVSCSFHQKCCLCLGLAVVVVELDELTMISSKKLLLPLVYMNRQTIATNANIVISIPATDIHRAFEFRRRDVHSSLRLDL